MRHSRRLRLWGMRLLPLSEQQAIHLANGAWYSMDSTNSKPTLAAGFIMQASCLGLL